MGVGDLIFEVLEEACLVVSCQSRFNPSDKEWDEWLSATCALERRAGKVRVLAMTLGGHPTRHQVDKLRAANKSHPPTAILSPSLAVRFLCSALTFANRSLRTYSPAELDEALEYLGITGPERRDARAALARLETRVEAFSTAS